MKNLSPQIRILTTYLISQIFQTKVQLLRAKKVFHHCNSKQLFCGYIDVRTTAALVVFFLLFVLPSPSFRKMYGQSWKFYISTITIHETLTLFFWNYLCVLCIPLPSDISSTWATQPNCSSFWVCGQRVRLHNLK